MTDSSDESSIKPWSLIALAVAIPILFIGFGFFFKVMGLIFFGPKVLPGQVTLWAVIVAAILIFKFMWPRPRSY